jgi:hypothetical protein
MRHSECAPAPPARTHVKYCHVNRLRLPVVGQGQRHRPVDRPTQRRATATAGCCASWVGGAKTYGAPSLKHGPRRVLITRSTLQHITPPKHTQKLARGLPYVLNDPPDDSLAALSSASRDVADAAQCVTTQPRPRHRRRKQGGAAGKAYQKPAPRVIQSLCQLTASAGLLSDWL